MAGALKELGTRISVEKAHRISVHHDERHTCKIVKDLGCKKNNHLRHVQSLKQDKETYAKNLIKGKRQSNLVRDFFWIQQQSKHQKKLL